MTEVTGGTVVTNVMVVIGETVVTDVRVLYCRAHTCHSLKLYMYMYT